MLGAEQVAQWFTVAFSPGPDPADPGSSPTLGEDSQTVVAQESSVSVSPRGTVTLTCGLSSGSQTQGRSPCMLISDTSSHSSEVPDRFSGSISGNKAALTITGAQPEDEADY
ncbi:unnamed protein product [Nyctereutes procyonoides]|uniref:(raccoon dog) hypothetical protein n=1 Tax=Nyctereutes procyonoides TaxID=34880 RepID=A0A811XQE3_NYCPR|nr:unnamed protein product [Nyctereutes procyonoides]